MLQSPLKNFLANSPCIFSILALLHPDVSFLTAFWEFCIFSISHTGPSLLSDLSPSPVQGNLGRLCLSPLLLPFPGAVASLPQARRASKPAGFPMGEKGLESQPVPAPVPAGSLLCAQRVPGKRTPRTKRGQSSQRARG